jgi:hypothetical protein
LERCTRAWKGRDVSLDKENTIRVGPNLSFASWLQAEEEEEEEEEEEIDRRWLSHCHPGA